MKKMITKTLPAGRELDALVAEKVMGWTKAAYYKDGAGCYPEDATPLYAATPWGTTCKGGSKPFYTEDMTLFGRLPGGIGEKWSPSTDIAAAWEVWRKMKAHGEGYFNAFLSNLCVVTGAIEHAGPGCQPYSEAMWRMDPAAICRAALLLKKEGV